MYEIGEKIVSEKEKEEESDGGQEKIQQGFRGDITCHPVISTISLKDPILIKMPHRVHLIPRPECAMTPSLWKDLEPATVVTVHQPR